ncbi:MAG: PDZ domain-containing protein [Actinobacteria bacterium]|nr:PDZ domain-containing protein [Actinomycetota bacterium]
MKKSDVRALQALSPGAEDRLVKWRRVAGALGAVLIVVVAFIVPVPAIYAFLPGPARDVERLIEINDTRTYSSEGKLYLTTVLVDTQVTLAEWIETAIDPNKAIVLKSDFAPEGVSLDELDRQQRVAISDSKQHAQEVALAALGYGHPTGSGAQVEQTEPGQPAYGVLEPGDVILSVDGRRVETSCDVGSAVARHAVGERVTLRVRRDGRELALSLRTGDDPADPRAPFLGVAMSDVDYKFDPGVEATFSTGTIGGPSAGLMFSLALYDRLTSDDLTGARSIAGTGTIGCDGGVGPIGGVEQKVAGAELKGADVFLAPVANAEAARRAANEMDVVAISTFYEAVKYLEDLE